MARQVLAGRGVARLGGHGRGRNVKARNVGARMPRRFKQTKKEKG
jgi:hypothetical protein